MAKNHARPTGTSVSKLMHRLVRARRTKINEEFGVGKYISRHIEALSRED